MRTLKVWAAAAVVCGGLASIPANAMPVAPLSAEPSNAVQNVRWVCNPYGRCWWQPSYYGAYAFYPRYHRPYWGYRRFHGWHHRW